MLIKYYTTDATLIIIENVTDVAVPASLNAEDYSAYAEYCFDAVSEDTGFPCKYITYSKDGPCALMVYNIAYICNDEGKTIEKVYVDQGSV